MTATIPVFKPNLHVTETLLELSHVLQSGWIGLGPKTKQFEDRFAAYHKKKFAVAVNSCTAALHLAVIAAGIKEGDEVLVPSLTFASTALALLYQKAVPVFVDINEHDLNASVDSARAHVTEKTKAIVVTHFGGHPVDMAAFQRLARERNLVLIEDNAHGCGGYYGDKLLGTIGDLGCFSFHAVKNLPTGDGGMILTDDEKQAEQLRKLRWLGIDKDTWVRAGDQYSWRYSIDELGYKYHMNDLTATIGLVQLEYLLEDNLARAQIAKRYNEKLSKRFLRLPDAALACKPSWHNYVVRVNPTYSRDLLAKYLAEKGISTSVHYEPLHLHKVFAETSVYFNLTNTMTAWPELLTLPMYPSLSIEDQDRIIATVHSFFEGPK